jgi:ABC-type sugar transport system permease subunit
MAYFFVLPNLLIFGLFVLFPMLLNIYYAFTGGTALFPQNRPLSGLQNFQQIFNCANFLDPNSCREDLFWRGALQHGLLCDLQGGRHGRAGDAQQWCSTAPSPGAASFAASSSTRCCSRPWWWR